jgi:protein-S-isoprenylcysteine O-methyltransferase Ste14
MTLQDKMVQNGQLLFRWRSYVPGIFVCLIAISMLEFNYVLDDRRMHEVWATTCLFVSLIGLMLRMLVVGYVPPGTSGGNTKRQLAVELNIVGMYSLVRHPLYLGNFLIWLGVSLLPGSFWLFATYVALFCLYYERIALAEESFLRASFGDSFSRWAAKTPAFIPSRVRWTPPNRDFCLAFTLRREYPTVLGIAVAFPLLDLIGHWRAEGLADTELPWALLFAGGAGSALLIRFLKKRTQYFAQS